MRVVACLCISAAIAKVASAAGWEVVEPDDGADLPGMRYAHSYASLGQSLVVTHGYFYDRKLNAPHWRRDSWALDMATRQWAPLQRDLSSADQTSGESNAACSTCHF